jgi:hypothetical protein
MEDNTNTNVLNNQNNQKTDLNSGVSLTILFISLVGAPVFYFVSPFLSTFFVTIFISTFFYKVLDVKDPQGLDVQWALPLPGNPKVNAKLAGAVASAIVIAPLSWYAVRQEYNIKDRQLVIDESPHNDYYVKPEFANIQGPQPVGQIQLYEELNKLKEKKPFSFIFQKIQSDCPITEGAVQSGLCAIPSKFAVRIIGSADLGQGKAVVCGQRFKDLSEQAYKIYPEDPNSKDAIKDAPTVKINGSVTIIQCRRAIDTNNPSLVVNSDLRRLVDPQKLYQAKIAD